MTNFENLILKKKKKGFLNNFSMSRTITMCKMRSIETIIKIKIKIKIKIANIAKIDVVKTKFRAIKQKNLEITILLIYQK